jgi:hypothetical protein
MFTACSTWGMVNMSKKALLGSSSILGRSLAQNKKKQKTKKKTYRQPFTQLPEEPKKTKRHFQFTNPETGGCGGYDRIGEGAYKSEADKPVLIGFKCTPAAEKELVALAEINGIRFDSRADMYRWAIEQALGVKMLTPRKRQRIEAIGPVIVYERNIEPVTIHRPENDDDGKSK